MKRFLYVMCVATICQPIYAAASDGQSQQAQSAAVIDWALLNLPIYRNAMQFAKKGPPVEIPVPPEVDPPCQLCGDTAKSMGELQVD